MPVNKEDTEIYTKWLNDFKIGGNLGNYFRLFTLDAEKNFCDKAIPDDQTYAIVLNNGDKLIGNISLMFIDHISRSATVGIFIGEKSDRSKGYGSESLKLIILWI